MDEMVIRAMAKWPNVPAVFGWLRLDRRGRWWIRDELVSNPGISSFIGRNYLADAQGRYFFQNGPQQVFVELEQTPWIFHVAGQGGAAPIFMDHVGNPVLPDGAGIDEQGVLYLLCSGRIGAVDERDLIHLIELMTDANGRKADDLLLASWMVAAVDAPTLLLTLGNGSKLLLQRLSSDELPTQFGYCLRPEISRTA